MIDIVMIILILFAIIVMLYAMVERSIIFIVLSSCLWIIIAALTIQGIEVPYQMFNATSGNIETGMQTVKTNLEPLAYFFGLLGIIMFIFFVTSTMETLGDYRRMKK